MRSRRPPPSSPKPLHPNHLKIAFESPLVSHFPSLKRSKFSNIPTLCCVLCGENLAHKQRTETRSTLLFHHHPLPKENADHGSFHCGGRSMEAGVPLQRSSCLVLCVSFFCTSRTRFEGLSCVRTFFPTALLAQQISYPKASERGGGSPGGARLIRLLFGRVLCC